MTSEALQLRGLAVHDIDGVKVGEVVDFFMDARTNQPEWLVVEAGLVEHRNALVPLDDLDRSGERLTTPYPKETIMQGPDVDGPSIDLDTERVLYDHFHLRRELPGRSTEVPAFEQPNGEPDSFRLRSWKSANAG